MKEHHVRRTGYKYTEWERLESYYGQFLFTNWCKRAGKRALWMTGFTARAVVFLSTNIIAMVMGAMKTTPGTK